MLFQDENIWILGCSSGIGRALAFNLAKGGARLFLSSRRRKLLLELSEELQAASPKNIKPSIHPLDVCDAKALQKTAQSIARQSGFLQRVIFMAASYHPSSIMEMDRENTLSVINTNLIAAFTLTQALLPIFKEQKKAASLAVQQADVKKKLAQLVFCSSIVAELGLANAQPYSSTKAALKNFAESLAAETYISSKKEAWLDVKIISPGFVETPLTDKNAFSMPFCISADEAAQHIAKGLRKKAFEIHFPKIFTFSLKLFRLLPDFVKTPLSAKIK